MVLYALRRIPAAYPSPRRLRSAGQKGRMVAPEISRESGKKKLSIRQLGAQIPLQKAERRCCVRGERHGCRESQGWAREGPSLTASGAAPETREVWPRSGQTRMLGRAFSLVTFSLRVQRESNSAGRPKPRTSRPPDNEPGRWSRHTQLQTIREEPHPEKQRQQRRTQNKHSAFRQCPPHITANPNCSAKTTRKKSPAGEAGHSGRRQPGCRGTPGKIRSES